MTSAGIPRLPETVPIPGGWLETLERDGSVRRVEILPFRLGRTPVTNREYAGLIAATGAPEPPWWNDPSFRAPLQPVVGATWNEAASYCAWLGLTAGGRWRLPTEAEWEHAASGGLARPRTAWGDEIPPAEIPQGPLTGPWEVGRGTPNGYGLCDMGTIVHEWCLDWREADPNAAADSRDVPSRRASRGGSWRHRIRWSSPSARSSLPPDFRYSDFGFRVLTEID